MNKLLRCLSTAVGYLTRHVPSVGLVFARPMFALLKESCIYFMSAMIPVWQHLLSFRVNSQGETQGRLLSSFNVHLILFQSSRHLQLLWYLSPLVDTRTWFCWNLKSQYQFNGFNTAYSRLRKYIAYTGPYLRTNQHGPWPRSTTNFSNQDLYCAISWSELMTPMIQAFRISYRVKVVKFVKLVISW